MMPKHSFATSNELKELIDEYFKYIEGDYEQENDAIAESKTGIILKQKVWMREPEPATFTGLAIFLGFQSKEAFESYEKKGRFASILKQGRLRIEAIYEKKLHQQSSAAGAIFALKNMGWNEKADTKTIAKMNLKKIRIEIIETGPKTASDEKEVVL